MSECVSVCVFLCFVPSLTVRFVTSADTHTEITGGALSNDNRYWYIGDGRHFVVYDVSNPRLVANLSTSPYCKPFP